MGSENNMVAVRPVRDNTREALRLAKLEAVQVYGIAWHRLEEISQAELIVRQLARLASPQPDAQQGKVDSLIAEARADMDKRREVNTILAYLLAKLQPDCPDMAARIKAGNEACDQLMVALTTPPSPALDAATIERVLDGIDRTITDGDGWWETSVGAAFGAEKLVELLSALPNAEKRHG